MRTTKTAIAPMLALGLFACGSEPVSRADFDPSGDTGTSQEPLPESDGGACVPPIPPVPDGAPCDSQDDCYFDACTKSVCIDFECWHEAYPDGALCFGVVPPIEHFAGTCDCGTCVELPPP